MHLFTRTGYSERFHWFFKVQRFCHKLLLEQRDKNHTRAGSLPFLEQGHQLAGGQLQPQEAGEREIKGTLGAMELVYCFVTFPKRKASLFLSGLCQNSFAPGGDRGRGH